MVRKVFGITAGFLVACGLLAGILGNDWVPFCNSVKNDAAKKLLSLVDQSELRLQQAEQQIRRFDEAVKENAGDVVLVAAKLEKLKRRRELTQVEINRYRGDLEQLKTGLLTGSGLVSTTGRQLAPAELQDRVDHQARMIDIRQSELKVLDKLLAVGNQRLATIQRFAVEAPRKRQQLVAQCELLKAKMVTANELKLWQAELQSFDVATDDRFQEVMESLEELGVQVDAEVAGMTALMELETEGPGIPTQQVSTEQLLAQIDRTLQPAR